MIEQQILPFCHFYKGEAICPPKFDGKHEGKLWQAEMMVCTHFNKCVDASNPQLSVAQLVSSYVGKWAPYKFREVMDVYFKCVPEMRSKVT